MKIRQGFVSNSSSSSFIIHTYGSNHLSVYDVKTDEFTQWQPEDILKWVRSMVKREHKKLNFDITQDELNDNIKLSKLSEVIEEYDLPFWYAGYELQYDDDLVLYVEDGYMSDVLAKKVCKKFDINSYHLHMG